MTLARQQVDETVIHAPFRGHVSARPVAAGEYVTTASSIATVVRIQPIKLELQVPEADAAQIRVGMTVAAHGASHADREFVGHITAKNPALSVESRAITVVAEFKNEARRSIPGCLPRRRSGCVSGLAVGCTEPGDFSFVRRLDVDADLTRLGFRVALLPGRATRRP